MPPVAHNIDQVSVKCAVFVLKFKGNILKKQTHFIHIDTILISLTSSFSKFSSSRPLCFMGCGSNSTLESCDKVRHGASFKKSPEYEGAFLQSGNTWLK